MKRIAPVLVLFFAAGCGSHRHADHAPHGGATAEDPRPALSFTDWTNATELFVEFRALVRGQESSFAAHVTKLEGFSALSEGRVSVLLRGEGADERFDANAPTVPGIFRPVARPTSTGKRRLVVEIRAKGISVDHDLGEITVYDSVASAISGTPEEPEQPGRIVFLKEQQWPVPFGTAIVSDRPIGTVVRAVGELRPRSDGDVFVTAPVAGRISTSGRAFPRLGERVSVEDPLAVLAPRLDAADVASLELAVRSAELESRFALGERDRLVGLKSAGAVPARRVLDAAHAADGANVALSAARRRLEQFRRVQRTDGRGAGAVQLRAPLSGIVTEVSVGPGTFVEAGTPLFRVTDTTQLWLEVSVSEADLGKLGTPRAVSFLLDGAEERIELGADALVARTSIIDPVTRTLRLYYAVDNAGARLAVGSFGRAFIDAGDRRRALSVPESSIVDDNGMMVVFVQAEGESFERRIVNLGAHDRGYVEILSGVANGEHVVSRGAWFVKLAASSGSIPAHGHSH